MRIIHTVSILVVLAFLTACGSSGGGSDASPSSGVGNNLVPSAPAGGGVQGYSVFSDYGQIPDRMSLNYTGFQIDTPVVRFYYQYADGSIHDSVTLDSSNPEVRRCRDTIEFTGTESEGTITISGAMLGWANDTTEFANDTHCQVNNGTYHYYVDSSGLWMGPVGNETLYSL